MRVEPKRLWIYVAILTIIPLLGVYASFAILSHWADKIGGLGFTMDQQYRASVATQGLAIPFITSALLMIILFLHVVVKIDRHNRPAYFYGFICFCFFV